MHSPQDFGLVKAAYSVKETIALLAIGRTFLYSRVRAGDIKATKCGKKTLFLSADIAAFLNKIRNAEVGQ